jgi:hypothetical protein
MLDLRDRVQNTFDFKKYNSVLYFSMDKVRSPHDLDLRLYKSTYPSIFYHVLYTCIKLCTVHILYIVVNVQQQYLDTVK